MKAIKDNQFLTEEQANDIRGGFVFTADFIPNFCPICASMRLFYKDGRYYCQDCGNVIEG